MGSLLRGYLNLINRYPNTSQIFQTGLLMGAGDVVAQTYVEKTPINEIKWVRTGQYAGLGFFLVGPALTQWYKVLNRFVGKPTDAKFTKGVKKMAADQLIFAPGFLAIFLPVLGVVKGKSWEENKRDVKGQYLDIVLMNWTIWPAFQIINFSLVPLNMQVVFVQVLAIIWNTYLSWKTSKK